MKRILIILAILGFVGAVAWFYQGSERILIKKDFINGSSIISLPGSDNKEEQVQVGKQNSLSGISCEDYDRRPFAVMYAGDSIARPLSGIGSADLVVEAQVITGSITRMMALFTCGNPSRVGSIRSARHDFIPLAQGFDAVYVHWGGSHFALEKLKQKVINNIDALTNPFEVFYRDESIPAPHNGFTSMDRMINTAGKLGYRSKSKFEGYLFQGGDDIKKNLALSDSCVAQKKFCTLDIFYSGVYKVSYEYDFRTNEYTRHRGGKVEIDKLDNKEVRAKNIVVMRAKSRQIEGQYNDIDVEGEGIAIIYQNGREIKGTWKKDEMNKQSKLSFFNQNNDEIKFVPGQIWIEIVDPTQKVIWR